MSSRHCALSRRHIAAGVTLFLAISVAGCGTNDPDANNYPWHERPTSAPTLVPVPTPDDEVTTEPEVDETTSHEVDLIVEALLDQDITVAGVHDLLTVPELTDGIHYEKVTSIVEDIAEDGQSDLFRVTRVSNSTLASDGSVEVSEVSYKLVDIDDGQHLEFMGFVAHWQVGANGDRVPVTSRWEPHTLGDGEWITESCGEHLLGFKSASPTGEGSVYRLHPAGGSEPIALTPELMGIGESDRIMRVEFTGCNDTRVLLKVMAWPEEGGGVLVSLDVRNTEQSERLDGGLLATLVGDNVVVADVAPERGTLRPRDSAQQDVPVVTLPGTDELAWAAMAGAEDYLAVVLHSRETSSRRGGMMFGYETYVVTINVHTSQARIFRHHGDADSWRRVLDIQGDVMQVALMSGQRPQSFVISLEFGSAARAPEGNAVPVDFAVSEIELAEDVIGIRAVEGVVTRGSASMSSSIYTIGRLTDPSTW